MSAAPSIALPRWHQWCGRSALVAVAVFLLGRIVLEPVRKLPQFDAKGMDPFSAVEIYRLREDDRPFRVAMFGSSVSIWGVLPELVADEMKLSHEDVRKLAVVGGTPFDHWKLVERNPEEFAETHVALVELNPRMLNPNMESDERVSFTISQHASWRERNELMHHQQRGWQRIEMVLPLVSVRRSLRSAFLNGVHPVHGTPIYPKPDARLYPFIGWHIPEGTKPDFRDIVPPAMAARRIVDRWRFSHLQDGCLRKLLQFFREREVRVILYQLPVHPEVAEQVRAVPEYAEGYRDFEAYVDSLGVPPSDRIQILDIDECGVPVEGMRDLTHFNEIGAKIYSRWLGSRLTAMLEPERPAFRQ